MLTGSDLGTKDNSLQMMHGVQTCSAADVAKELNIHWVVHRIVWGQLDYREACVHLVPKNLQCVSVASFFQILYCVCSEDKMARTA